MRHKRTLIHHGRFGQIAFALLLGPSGCTSTALVPELVGLSKLLGLLTGGGANT
jgi:hypothetical protein